MRGMSRKARLANFQGSKHVASMLPWLAQRMHKLTVILGIKGTLLPPLFHTGYMSLGLECVLRIRAPFSKRTVLPMEKPDSSNDMLGLFALSLKIQHTGTIGAPLSHVMLAIGGGGGVRGLFSLYRGPSRQALKHRMLQMEQQARLHWTQSSFNLSILTQVFIRQRCPSLEKKQPALPMLAPSTATFKLTPSSHPPEEGRKKPETQ